jgi:hypothetical protein
LRRRELPRRRAWVRRESVRVSSGEWSDQVNASAAQSVQVGDGGTQHNYFFGVPGDRPGAVTGPVVVGDVPQEPAAFQPRAGLMESLEGQGTGRVRVVFAVTGLRGARPRLRRRTRGAGWLRGGGWWPGWTPAVRRLFSRGWRR